MPTTPISEQRASSRASPAGRARRRRRGRRRPPTGRPSGEAMTRPYWMTREPPLNWVGVTLASSAPWIVSKTSFETFSPRCTKQAPTIVSSAATRSNEPCRAAIRIPRVDRHQRRGEERQPGAAQGQEAERQARLDRRAALRRQRVEVLARLADRPLRVLEERDLGLVPAPGRVATDRDGSRRATAPAPRPSRGAARRSRSRAAAGCANRSARCRRWSGWPGRPARRTARCRWPGSISRLDRDAHRVAGRRRPRSRPGRDRWPASRDRSVRRSRVCCASGGLLADRSSRPAAVAAFPSDQYRTRRGVISISARSKKSGSATRALRK